MSQEDIEWMREGYRLFREHDPAYMDRFASNAAFKVPLSLPAGGTYEGAWDALEFTTTVNERLDDPHPVPEEFIRDGDRVVVLGRWHAVVPATGHQVSVRVMHIFTVESADAPLAGQLITAFEFLPDTAAFAAALAEADAD